MPVIQQGSINTAALTLPDVYVQVMNPPLVINGLPTNILGIVGTATWGPVNSPVIIGDVRAAVAAFGNPTTKPAYDLVTAIWTASMQGANNIRAVRVTDGTDAAAAIVVLTNCITFTAKYTGTLGNSITVTLATGTAASSYKATVSLPGYAAESFDNITGSGNALWVNIAYAINNGNNASRGPSALIVASAGVGVTVPTLTTYTLTAGLDGASTITSTVLLGVDTTPRKGMYALRNTGVSVVALADAYDTTTWATQVAFGLSEGCYMVLVGPSGDTIANAVTTKGTAGIDTYIGKCVFGDWVYFLDTINNATRMVSPSGFVGGRLANLSPEQSGLNKPMYGIVGTQKSATNQVYSGAELQTLAAAGIDVITNPIPAGSMFGLRFGHNSSSNWSIHGDNYTRMTNFLAYTLDSAMGIFVGRLQSSQVNDPLRRELKNTVENFLDGLVQQKMIDSYQTQCDLGNNTLPRISAGYLQIDVKVKYLAVVEYLIINLEGGQTVVINRVSTTPAS